MKKLCSILLVSICFLVASCDNKELVLMQVSPQTVSMTDASISLIIENQTRRDLEFGAYFILQYFNNENWETIQFDFSFLDIMYGLKSGGTQEMRLLSGESFAKYIVKPGKYRILKDFISESLGRFELKAEFQVVE
jgi:hypothetical protein